MEIIKNDFSGGLNLDDSPYKMPHNSYSDALNISKDAVEGSNDKVITNVVGNRLVNYTLPAGINKCIGAFPFQLRNTVIYFIWNSNGYHLVLEYNNTTRSIVPIFSNLTDSAGIDILGFTQYNKITSVNVLPRETEGDLLNLVDSLGRPTVFNILKFKAGAYIPVTRSIIHFAIEPPLIPIAAIYYNDATTNSNSLRNRLFRFKYRYVYDDFQKSTPSPISLIPLPKNILDSTFTNVITNNNFINLSIINGSKNVKRVEILMSYVQKLNDWSDYALVESIDVTSYPKNISFLYSFYNNGVYPVIDIAESIQLFDYVPDKANTMEFPNGNIPVFAGITEGYDKDLVPNVIVLVLVTPAGTGGGTGELTATVTQSSVITQTTAAITFSGIPAVGTLVVLKLKRLSDNVILIVATYTTISGDTSATVATGLVASANAIGITVFSYTAGNIGYFRWSNGFYSFSSIAVTPPSTSLASNSIPTFPFSDSGRIGLVYFDKWSKTNGVIYDTKYSLPAYSETGGGLVNLPYIDAFISHVPPIWAYSMQWVMTKRNTNYIYWHTLNVNFSETDYIYFDVSNFALNQKKSPTTTNVLSYTFQDGDRLRLIKRMTDGFVFSDTYDAAIEGLVVDPKISSAIVAGTFVKIKKSLPFFDGMFTTPYFVIQLYRPSQQIADNSANQPFYEIGQQYNIVNPELSTRYHSGMITDQVVGSIPAEYKFYGGDAYFRSRSIALTDTGTATFNVLDRNFVDFYISAVNNIDGRPNIIDINMRKAYYSTMIRFGQAYQSNTNINGTNRFYFNNFDEYDISAGDVIRLKVRDRYLRVFQKYKIGTVPLYNQISKSANGTQLLVVTDKLLNPIQYYVGNFGIGDNAESLASFDFADYFTSNIKGGVFRVSNDGIQQISSLYKINSFSTDKLPLRKGNYKVYGAFDQKLHNYIFALEATDTDPAATITFDEEGNTFDSLVSYAPEMMTTLGTLLISFKDGQLYTHDSTVYANFYGVQYPCYITPIFNEASAEVKSFMAIEEKSNNVWECPAIETSLMSYGTTPQQSNLVLNDFKLKEGKWCASFLRDINSIKGLNNGGVLKGDWMKIKMQNNNATKLVSLNLVSIRVIDSPLNNK